MGKKGKLSRIPFHTNCKLFSVLIFIHCSFRSDSNRNLYTSLSVLYVYVCVGVSVCVCQRVCIGSQMLMSKERRQAGRAALPRRAFGFHVQFFSPYSRSPRTPCRITTALRLRTEIWLHPSQHHRPSRTPRHVGSLCVCVKKKAIIVCQKYLIIFICSHPLLVRRQSRLDRLSRQIARPALKEIRQTQHYTVSKKDEAKAGVTYVRRASPARLFGKTCISDCDSESSGPVQ